MIFCNAHLDHRSLSGIMWCQVVLGFNHVMFKAGAPVLPGGDLLTSLHEALLGAFPTCTELVDDPSRGISSFTPHLSLGQWQDKQQLLADLQVTPQALAHVCPAMVPGL
jgi:hypothetical protein